MNPTTNTAVVSLIGDRELTISRFFAAPPAIVAACTQPEHVVR